MITIRNEQQSVALDTKTLKQHAQTMLDTLGYSDFDLGILLASDAKMHEFNKAYRGKDRPTDILSFPYHESLKPGEKIIPTSDEDKNLGDLIIAPGYVKEDAPRWGHSFTERLDILLAHGIAHLLGYDHQTDEEFAVMQKVEERLLKSIQ